MDRLDQLLIRACKSADPAKRLASVRRRYYFPQKAGSLEDRNLTARLQILCQKYDLIDVVSIIDALNPNKFPKPEQPYCYWRETKWCFLGLIRYAEYAKFPGLIKPNRIRHALATRKNTV